MRLRSKCRLSYYLEVAPTWSRWSTFRSNTCSHRRQHLYPSFQATLSCCGRGTAALRAQLLQLRHYLRCCRAAAPMMSSHPFHGSLHSDPGGKGTFVKREKRKQRTKTKKMSDVSTFIFHERRTTQLFSDPSRGTHNICYLLDPSPLTSLKAAGSPTSHASLGRRAPHPLPPHLAHSSP